MLYEFRVKSRIPNPKCYVPRGQAYVPGLRRATASRTSPVKPPAAASPHEPASSPNASAASESKPHDVVLFGGDPMVHETPKPSPPAEPPPPQPKSFLSCLAALYETRWWVVLPICMTSLAIGVMRLHSDHPSIRAKDGAIVELVSEARDTPAALAAREADPERLLRQQALRPVEIATLAPEASGFRKAPASTILPAPALRRAATTDVDHIGAIPRTALCTYVEPERTKVAPVVKAPDASFGASLADAAEAQSRDFVVYDDKYRTIKYPGGDVASLYGVCSDVVVRAYRALGIDLQALIHEARIGAPDASIAHRRTENLRRFFKRAGASLPITDFPEDYLPGDVVTYDRPQNRGAQDHIAIVSNIRGQSGRFMIVHNRGFGPQIEDALFVDRITGHYRFNGETRTAPGADTRQFPGRARNAAAKMLKRAERAKARAKAARTKSPPEL